VVEEAVIKLLYKPVGLLINWLYGVLAGAVVNRVWTSAIRADDAPKATDAQRRWKSFQMRAHATGIGSGGCADGRMAAVHQMRARRACLPLRTPAACHQLGHDVPSQEAPQWKHQKQQRP
jgi:Protein of unknown function (DUF4235)